MGRRPARSRRRGRRLMGAAPPPMRVMFAISHSEAAGAQAIWADLASAFQQRGHDVSLAAIYPGSDGGMKLPEGLAWDHCLPRPPKPGADTLRAVGGAIRLLRSRAAQAIFTALPAANVIFPLGPDPAHPLGRRHPRRGGRRLRLPSGPGLAGAQVRLVCREGDGDYQRAPARRGGADQGAEAHARRQELLGAPGRGIGAARRAEELPRAHPGDGPRRRRVAGDHRRRSRRGRPAGAGERVRRGRAGRVLRLEVQGRHPGRRRRE